MTQLEQARQGTITPEMVRVAEAEKRSVDFILSGMATGQIVILANPRHPRSQPLGIGNGLRTKVNANLGTSTDQSDKDQEWQKAHVAVAAGADALMDLSLGGDLWALRQQLLDQFPLPLGTVPIYEAAVRAKAQGRKIIDLTAEEMLQVVREQAAQGVDFMTIHAGLTQASLERFMQQGRIIDIVSRGGALLGSWIFYHQKQNPYYEYFDKVLDICRQYEVTISLGDGLRPGCLEDATDRAQIQELIYLGELAQRAQAAGVQVMIEGPGHMPIDQITANVILEKRLCQGAPFYVLGPLVTDVAAGYDHIACAIGGALAASAGADFLCYVTPSEHLRLPDVSDVQAGVMAARIAAHAADIVKGVPGAREWDRAMSQARKNLDWEKQIQLSLDPQQARRLRGSSQPFNEEVCTMCGEFCALKNLAENLPTGSRP